MIRSEYIVDLSRLIVIALRHDREDLADRRRARRCRRAPSPGDARAGLRARRRRRRCRWCSRPTCRSAALAGNWLIKRVVHLLADLRDRRPSASSVAATSNARSTRIFSPRVSVVRRISDDELSKIGRELGLRCGLGRGVGDRDQTLGQRNDVGLGHHHRAPLGARRVFQREAARIAHESIAAAEERVDVGDRRKARLRRGQPLAHERLGGAPLHERVRCP